MQIGLFTFGETHVDPASGRQLDAGERLRNLMEEVELADQVGLDVYGVGEHHRPDYAVSSPATVLAAAAARTERIRLTSTVSVLSSDDPVRVFQQFATLDLLSGGRAEITAGRGSFIESFPLFGYDLELYHELFAEKLELLLKLRELGPDDRITWQGRHRAPLVDQGVYPKPVQDPLPIWVAVGGTPQSVVRAARLGLPLAVAIIGGAPVRFKPLVQLYRDTLVEAGRDPADFPVSINGHGFVAETSQGARTTALPAFAGTMSRIGRERGWPPTSPAQLDADTDLRGGLFMGSPQEIVDKILYQHELFDHDRVLLQLTVGPIPHREVLRAIELLGTEVAPAVRKALGVASPPPTVIASD